MGSFSGEFYNVASPDISSGQTFDPISPSARGVIGRDARERLQRIMDAASGTIANPKGGIVYLPPGDYRIGWDVTKHAPGSIFPTALARPDLFVPPNVMLWFAPGARLTIAPEVVIKIAGSLRAELLQIFAVDPLPDPGPTIVSPRRRGRVVFETTRVLEVYPEWWGAVSAPDSTAMFAETNTTALEDCIRAAHTDRFFPGGRLFPALPIVLTGNYFTNRELVVEAKRANLIMLPDRSVGPDPDDPRWREVGVGSGNFDGLVLWGKRGAGSSGAVRPTLAAAPDFRSNGVHDVDGRALLRINGLHGSVIEGVAFDANLVASTCVQITGHNARSSTFRDCSFRNAKDVLAQVGDYVITTNEHAIMVDDRRLPRLRNDVYGDYDLTGLTFVNCTFVVDFSSDDTSRQRVGLVFHANNTLPLTLDHCVFTGPMLACIEAYGGTMIIRGGTAQNQLLARPYDSFAQSAPWRDRPRGGVDIFIGDPPLLYLVDATTGHPLPDPATSPTGVTVIEFQSQSNQFMDTFRHKSASSGRALFLPTLLQGVAQYATTRDDARLYTAPPAVFWSGPGIRPSMSGSSGGPFVGSASTLTLVGCTFHGPRPSPHPDIATAGSREPSGVVVADSLCLLVADVGTTIRQGTNAPVFQFNRMAMPTASNRFSPLPIGSSPPVWYRKL